MFSSEVSSIYKEVIRPLVLDFFFFYDKISQALKSTKKHNQYTSFFQNKILSTLNAFLIILRMSP